jgi:hypothetical protein
MRDIESDVDRFVAAIKRRWDSGDARARALFTAISAVVVIALVVTVSLAANSSSSPAGNTSGGGSTASTCTTWIADSYANNPDGAQVHASVTGSQCDNGNPAGLVPGDPFHTTSGPPAGLEDPYGPAYCTVKFSGGTVWRVYDPNGSDESGDGYTLCSELQQNAGVPVVGGDN